MNNNNDDDDDDDDYNVERDLACGGIAAESEIRQLERPCRRQSQGKPSMARNDLSMGWDNGNDYNRNLPLPWQKMV